MPLNPFALQRPSLWPGGITNPFGAPIVFDASVREQHGQTSQIATFPIEGGAEVTDHKQIQPIALTIDVALATMGEDLIPRAVDAWKDQYQQILDVDASRIPFDFVTSLKIYTSMWFTSISAPRTAEGGEGMIVTLAMRVVEFATVDQAAVLADAALAIALGEQNLGNISPQADSALEGLAAVPVV